MTSAAINTQSRSYTTGIEHWDRNGSFSALCLGSVDPPDARISKPTRNWGSDVSAWRRETVAGDMKGRSPAKRLPKHVRQRTENRQGAEGLRGWMGEVSLAEARSSQDGRGHILFRAGEPAASDAMAPAQRSPSTIGHPFRPLILPTTPLPPVLHPISSHLWWPRARTPIRPQSPPRALINLSRLPARRSLV